MEISGRSHQPSAVGYPANATAEDAESDEVSRKYTSWRDGGPTVKDGLAEIVRVGAIL
jgi:hypothetical protein